MVVTIAGIKRSGSTAMYNIVRLALLEAGYDVNICGHSWDSRRKDMLVEDEADIIKRHPYDEEIASLSDHIFITDRNDIAILKSLDRMWGSGSHDQLKDMRKHLDKWKKCGSKVHYFDYSLIENDIIFVARKTIEYLGLNVHRMAVVDKFRQIEPPEDKQDPVTLLFPNHISQ